MKTLSDSGPLVRLLSLRWQLPCNLLVNELPKMTHWILLAPSGQLVFRDFLGFEIFLRFLLVGDLSLWLSLLLFLIPSRFSPCHLFYYNSFPVLVKSHGLLIYITTNVFPTGSSPPVGDFQQKLLPPRTIQPHYGTTTQPPRTILCCKPTKQQDIHTLAQNIRPTILPYYSHYQLELTLPTM